MEKILLIHGHLIINEYKEALDGAVSIIDGKIDKVFLNCTDFSNFNDYEIIDLENNYVFPAFISLEEVDSDFLYGFLRWHKQENALYSNFVKKEECDIKNINEEDIKILRNDISYNQKVLLDGEADFGDLKKIDKNLICIDNLFINTPNIGIGEENITNLAFSNEFYTKVKFDACLTLAIKKIVLNGINFNKMIISSINYQKDISFLFFDENIDLSNILQITSLNCARFLGIDNLYGTISKGKFAKLIVLDKNFNLIRKVGF